MDSRMRRKAGLERLPDAPRTMGGRGKWAVPVLPGVLGST